MKSFSVTTKNLTDRPYLSHKSADNLSEDLPLLSVSVSLKMARMGRSTDIHNLPPYRGCLCSAVVGPQGGGGKTFRIHNLEADNAEDGLKIILKEHPDIIITDMKMPVMDGIQL